jgi:hypothetical protein
MSRYLLGCTMVSICAQTAGLLAQQPPSNPQSQTTPTRTSSTQAQVATVTVEGCLMREQDVPVRRPNVAERAGILEDYILASAKMVKGSAPQASTTSAKPGQPVGTAGTQAPMYDVKGIDDERLKALAGRRVQIDGTFADLTKDPSAGPTQDLVIIQGTAIRQVAGECR